MKTHSIFCAKSAFWEVSNYLEDYALGCGVPDDMSDGLREIFHEDLKETLDGWGGKITWESYYRSSMYYVNFAQAVLPKVNKDKPYKYEGYVP